MAEDYQLDEEFAQAPLSKDVVRRLARYLAPYKAGFIAGLLMEVVWVGSMVLGPHLIKVGIDKYIAAASISGVFMIAALYAVNSIFRYSLVMVEIRVVASCGQNVLNDLRNAVFEHIQRLSMRYFDRTKQGKIIARADRDIEALEEIVTWGPVEFVSCIFCLAGVITVMCIYNWRLFCAVSTTLPPLAVASWIFQKKGLAAYRKVRESLSRVTANLAENICGVRVVQAFVREARNLSVFARLNRKHVKNVVRASFVWNSYTPFINITFVAATSIILIYGSSLIARGQLQIGELSAFILLLGMFFWPIEDLTQLYHATLSATAASERIFQLLQTEPEVKDRPGASPIGPIEGTVEFENVYFKYDEGDSKWVLKGVSFKALPGQTIALVGPTGGGKTSIVSLIPRFYEPQRGCVRIDGIDIKDVTLRSLHNQMGIVLQESFLFSGTVMENLKFARPDVSDEEVIEAARALGAHEVIMRLSEGYKTLVRERGTGLSQGQRQLICLTRAFIANPKILILDEATSSVDTIIEQTLQRALKRLTQRRTSFVVAHRLSTIRDADLVLVIEDGTVQEAGSHHQLMGRNGRYARMYGEYVRRLR